MYDIIIIGGGVGGLTAGIYARRANKSVLIIEKAYFGGQVATLNTICNYPGFEQIDGFSLSQKIYKQAKSLGVEFVTDEVISTTLADSEKIVTTYKNQYTAKAVIIATGAISKPLIVENEKKYLGNGLSYCATCDGNFFKNKKVAIALSSDSNFSDCIYLGNIVKELNVIISNDLPSINFDDTTAKINIFDNSKITSLSGENTLQKITIFDKKNNKEQNLDIDGLFVNLGKKPYTSCFSCLSLDENGYIITDPNMRTNLPNVYAIGDVRNTPLKQIVTACSDGAIAVNDIVKKKN